MGDAEFGRSAIWRVAIWRVTFLDDSLDLLVLQLVVVSIGVRQLCAQVSHICFRTVLRARTLLSVR